LVKNNKIITNKKNENTMLDQKYFKKITFQKVKISYSVKIKKLNKN
jgi:hypothetical protein